MTQPALSRCISRLERDAGERLFYRHTRGMTLTPFGVIVAEEARFLLRQIDEAERRVQITCKAMT